MKNLKHVENFLSDEEIDVPDSKHERIKYFFLSFLLFAIAAYLASLGYDIQPHLILAILVLFFALIPPKLNFLFVHSGRREILRLNHSKDVLDCSESLQWDYRIFCYSRQKYSNSSLFQYNRGFIYFNHKSILYKSSFQLFSSLLEPTFITFSTIEDIEIKACNAKMVDFLLGSFNYSSRLTISSNGNDYVFWVADAFLLKEKLLKHYAALGSP